MCLLPFPCMSLYLIPKYWKIKRLFKCDPPLTDTLKSRWDKHFQSQVSVFCLRLQVFSVISSILNSDVKFPNLSLCYSRILDWAPQKQTWDKGLYVNLSWKVSLRFIIHIAPLGIPGAGVDVLCLMTNASYRESAWAHMIGTQYQVCLCLSSWSAF